MPVYKIRRVRLDAKGNFRPTGKRAKYFTTWDKRLVVDGVYFLRGNEYYRVEKKF